LIETLSVAGVVPLDGLTESQLPPETVDAAAVKLSVEPKLVTLTDWPAGVAAPVVYENDKVVGLAAIDAPDVIFRTELAPVVKYKLPAASSTTPHGFDI